MLCLFFEGGLCCIVKQLECGFRDRGRVAVVRLRERCIGLFVLTLRAGLCD